MCNRKIYCSQLWFSCKSKLRIFTSETKKWKMILIIYVTLCYNPSAEYPQFLLYFFTPSLPYSLCLKCTLYSVHLSIFYNSYSLIMGQPIKTTQLWFGGSKLHSKLWFFYLYYFVLCSWIKIWNMNSFHFTL